jgi:hypothetical protein
LVVTPPPGAVTLNDTDAPATKLESVRVTFATIGTVLFVG